MSLSPGPGLPELDLELAVGVTLGAVRPHLAGLPGCAGALSEPIAADGVALDDAHRTGTFPLVAGARLRVGDPQVSDAGATAAVRAPWHLAVVGGPDAGTLWPVPEGAALRRPASRTARLVVGRRGPEPLATPPAASAGGPCALLADPLVSQAHLEVHLAARRVWVRDLGSANGARRSRAWSRHRVAGAVPRWHTRWRPGDRVTIGSSVLELRAALPPEPRSRRTARTWLFGLTALAPALGSLALAAGTRNPALLALGLAGPALAGVLLGRPAPRAPRASASIDAERPEPDRGGGPRGGPGVAVEPCALSAQLARSVLTGDAAPPSDALSSLAPAGVLAVSGPRAREVAATLVLAAQPEHLEAVGPHPERWDWSRWLDGSRGAVEAGPRVVVVDGTEARPEWGGPGRVVVLVDPDRVPSWCTARLDAASGRWEGPDGARDVSVLPGSPAWAEGHARRIAGARCVRAVGDGALPESVTLGALGLPLSAADVSTAWSRADGGLRALVGAGPEGRHAAVDLVREGPHVLVAGTTGSGKSELLRALVASLALRYPPTALAFALVDFKGGAGFGALAQLPHVVGTVTDLDPHEASRAIAGLAAELRARKALFARAGVTDLRDWPAEAAERHPGRLVVVIDEFRALAEELPDLMGALVRIATQGRSLGVHLVLATQRPSGVVGAELRANVALRFALRVTDSADSSDVIEVPDAATIPPALPGRALLRRGPGPVEELQVARVGIAAPPVRLVPPSAQAAEGESMDVRAPAPTAEDFDAELVAAVVEAAARWRPGATRPGAPWLPALPARITLTDVERSVPSPPEGSLPFALADVPDRQAREVAAWDPRAGHLLAVGGPGSGRSTLLATLGSAALARGWSVHAVGLPVGWWRQNGEAGLRGTDPPGVGTVCGADDPRRLARLVTLVREASPRTLLLVDDVSEAWRALERVARGAGAERFVELLRSRAVAVAVTTDRPSGPWASLVTERVVLPVGDPVAEEMAGVPRALSGARRGPGRAVWLPGRVEPVVCQVATTDGLAASGAQGAVPDARSSPPVRLVALPLIAPPPAAPRPRRRGLALGLGGDSARVVTLPVSSGALVVGPPGSGRSSAIAALVRVAALSGEDCVTFARDAGVLEATGGGPSFGFERGPLLERLDGASGRALVVIDDLDQLVRLVPEAAEAIDAFVDDGGRLLTSLTLDAALGAYRGAVATLRARRTGLVLAAHHPGSGEVFGSPLDWDCDPALPHHPGRGVVQHGALLSPVQVFAPG